MPPKEEFRLTVQPEEEAVTSKKKSKRRRRRALITVGSWPMLVASMAMFGASILVVQQNTVSRAALKTETAAARRTSNEQVVDTVKEENNFVHPPVLYGHVHMAKTAGSTVNGELAMRYERVCGNKGYSYDAFQNNRRFNASSTLSIRDQVDSISQIRPQYNRGRVPEMIMNEIGYEDCDYVSMEGNWEFWVKQFASWHLPLELHVPCRDPVDHFMSQWNNGHRWPFRCHPPKNINILDQAADTMVRLQRFSNALVTDYDNINVKCFDYQNTTQYIENIGARLQKKRLQGSYVFRSTNKPRDKSKECIWEDEEVREKIRSFLVENYDYYKFCGKCVGSSNDLLASK